MKGRRPAGIAAEPGRTWPAKNGESRAVVARISGPLGRLTLPAGSSSMSASSIRLASAAGIIFGRHPRRQRRRLVRGRRPHRVPPCCRVIRLVRHLGRVGRSVVGKRIVVFGRRSRPRASRPVWPAAAWRFHAARGSCPPGAGGGGVARSTSDSARQLAARSERDFRLFLPAIGLGASLHSITFQHQPA